jgi:hypothetical protein
LEIAILGNLKQKFFFVVDSGRSGGYYTPFGRKKAFGEIVKELVVFDFLGKKIYWGEEMSEDLRKVSEEFVGIVLKGFRLIMSDDPAQA